MTAKEAAKQAIDHTRRLLAESTDSEAATYDTFAEEFEAEMAGWKMRLEELADED